MKKVYLLAAIAAVLFAALMYLYLQGSQTAATSEETVTVVVATCDIGPDVTITESMVQEQQVPVSAKQVNSVSAKDDVVGKCCPAQIVKGEQVLKNMLEDPGATGTRLSAQISSGMRAMTIKAETDAGVGGYIQAGDHIDLLGVVLDEEGNVIASGMVVENVEVVRINEATKEGETPYSYITLSMTVSQCEEVYIYQSNYPSGSTTDYHALLRSAGGER